MKDIVLNNRTQCIFYKFLKTKVVIKHFWYQNQHFVTKNYCKFLFYVLD